MSRSGSRSRTLCAILAFASALAAFVALPSEADAHRVRVYPARPRARVYGAGAFVIAPHGWYGGVGLVGTKILDQRGGPEHVEDGGGLTIWGGIRFNERLAVELGWMGSLHNPATVTNGYWAESDYLVLEAFTADAKIHLDRSGNLDPYLQGGIGVYVLGREHFGIDAIGTGFQLGGGFDYWLGDNWSLGLRVRYHGISMAPPDDCAGCGSSGDNTYISAVTAEGNLGLHF
jgi:opacity protein-like surface antigen